jgi:hypothetical protein
MGTSAEDMPVAFYVFARGRARELCSNAAAAKITQEAQPARGMGWRGSLCAGRSLRRKSRACRVSHVQRVGSRGSPRSRAEEAAVLLVLRALGQPTMPVTIAAGLSHWRMHAHAQQVAA